MPASAAGKVILPWKTSVVGCAAKVNDATIPKLPPPPRIAQNRSGCCSALAETTSPVAVTTSAATSWSSARPYFLTFQPTPPARVRPPTPTLLVSPEEIARPYGASASTTWPQVAPPPITHEVTFGVDDLDRGELAEVDHDAAVVGAEALEGVAPAAHGEREPGVGRERDGGLDVGGGGGAQDVRRVARGEDRPAGRLVLGVSRLDDLAVEGPAQGVRG